MGASVDRAFVNGRIRTMDPAHPTATALGTREGRIVVVGDEAGVRAGLSGPTETVDLGGRVVTPGIIDSHSNLATTGIERHLLLDLRAASTPDIGSIQRKLRERAADRIGALWLQGVGWSEATLAERRPPTRAELDAVSGDRPVALTHLTGHSLTANSAALRIAGIQRSSPDPAGGEIIRDAMGEPTGLLQEFSAMQLVTKCIPPWQTDDWTEAVRAGTELYLAEGITATKENYPANEYAPLVAVYQRLAATGDLSVRLHVSARAASLNDVAWAAGHSELFVSPDPLRLRLGGIKIFLDGSLAARTAWTYDAYLTTSGQLDVDNHGYPALPEQEFRAIVSAAHRAGFAISVHAIGDRAVELATDAFAAALRFSPRNPHGHSIIHALLVRDVTLARIRDLGLAVETQPPFLLFLGDAYARAVPPERLRRILPLRTLLRSGVILGGGSDGPICPQGFRYAVAAATGRTTANGLGPSLFGAGERISALEVLELYTTGSSRCLGMDGIIGSLSVGKRADLVAWNGDPASSGTDELRPLLTVADGAIRFRAPDWSGD